MRPRRVLMVVAVVIMTACNSGAPTASVSPRPSISPSPTAAAPQQLCFTDPPTDWTTAMSNLVATFDAVNFGVGAIDEQRGIAYGGVWTPSSTYIASVDLSTGRMTPVAPMWSSGFGWMTFGEGWLAWPQPESKTWTIQLWNTGTHERRQIDTGAFPSGTAVVGNGYLAWNEVAEGTSDDLRVYRLASGKITTLDSGVAGPPVLAGKYLVWSKGHAGGGNPAFEFADAATLARVAPPAELRGTREIGAVAGSPSTLIWTGAPAVGSPNNGTWFVDDLASGIIRLYGARDHYFQFPQLAGAYLVWFGADKNSIVDLRTGDGFDISLPGEVEATGDTIIVTRGSTLKGNVDRSDVAVLHPSQLSPLGPC